MSEWSPESLCVVDMGMVMSRTIALDQEKMAEPPCPLRVRLREMAKSFWGWCVDVNSAENVHHGFSPQILMA